jgi:cob(I)alamin adenosyltransferase
MTRLYTRTGDGGQTGLASGARVDKTSVRIEALGAVDETNACIGMARAALTDAPALDQLLDRLQHRLFDLGADLATPGAAPRIGPDQARALEADIDALEDQLEPLRAFILPGGSAAAAALHLARTVCRRAERDVIRLAQTPGEPDAADARIFLNRLSDLLFAAARMANLDRGDVLWRALG